MAKFRVLAGLHSEGGKLYQKGDVVDSSSNLLRMNRRGAPKFAAVTEDEEAAPNPQQDEEPAPKAQAPKAAKGKKGQ